MKNTEEESISTQKEDSDYIKNFFNSPFYKHIRLYYKLYSTITLTLIFIPSLLYLLTYSFLYGYYFSGENNYDFSTFNIIKYFVPFNFNTITYTSLLFSIVIGSFLIIFKIIFNKNKPIVFFGILIAVIVHILLASFFINDPNKFEILNFAKIWAIPYFYGCIIYVSAKVIDSPLKTFFSFILGFIIATLIFIFIPDSIWEDGIYNSLILSTVFLLTGYIINKFKVNLYLLGIYFFPVIYLVTLLLAALLNTLFSIINLDIKYILLILIPFTLIIDWGILFIIKKNKLIDKFESKPIFTKENFNFKELFLAPYSKTKDKAKTMLIYLQSLLLLLLVFITYVTTPNLAVSTGFVIRNFSNDVSKSEIINYTLNNEIETLYGEIIVEDGNKLYISDKKYNLAIVNSQFYDASKLEEMNLQSKKEHTLLDMIINK